MDMPGFGGGQCGESGWEVEEIIFGGWLSAEWDSEVEVQNLSAIARVVLSSNLESSFWNIGKQAWNSIES